MRCVVWHVRFERDFRSAKPFYGYNHGVSRPGITVSERKFFDSLLPTCGAGPRTGVAFVAAGGLSVLSTMLPVPPSKVTLTFDTLNHPVLSDAPYCSRNFALSFHWAFLTNNVACLMSVARRGSPKVGF